ncbi:hypothetical protein DFH05DRAFT_922790 [Lentinula detonsa]|uniref:Uncharacterized protein n=1 Tax=Lentinula detonsa TaxID=2804962 RepID=A0A9W8TZ07_9AGAR|nr:hypothetical protein DFH05DRAFT_922790 [Lentinula detonsa]
MFICPSAAKFILVLRLIYSTAAYKQPFEYINAIESFANAFTNPTSVINNSIPSPLSEDVVGRIDITTTFVGQELNTEYLFGLFVEGASENTTQLIGTPTPSFTTQSLVIEPPVIAVSLVNTLWYPTIDSSFPLQIDLFIAFDDDMKIVSYDAILRRWSEFFNYVVPLLSPRIAQELNVTLDEGSNSTATSVAESLGLMNTTYTVVNGSNIGTALPQATNAINATLNTTELIRLKTAVDVCQMSTQYCTSENQVYASNDACMGFITQIPFGQPWEGGMDNGWCRYVHKSMYFFVLFLTRELTRQLLIHLPLPWSFCFKLDMVKYRPEVHCPHIGPTGGDMCIPRDYIQVTDSVPFNNTLLAFNASFNALDVENIPLNNQMELVRVETEVIYTTTVAYYSVSCVLYMLLLYVVAKAVEFFFGHFSLSYADMSFVNQRNTVTYVLAIFFTTATLILQLVASPILNTLSYTFTEVALLKVAALLISGLYVFELTYRVSMRWPLMTHHFCTIFAIVLLLSVLSYTRHPALMGAGEIWLFQATTEQSVFIGLLMYRMGCSHKMTRNVLYFAAVQSFIFKLAFAAYLLAFWAQHLIQFHSTSDDIALSILLVIMTVSLMCTQVYGAWAVWGLASKVNWSMHKHSIMIIGQSGSDDTVSSSYSTLVLKNNQSV